jgi:hypothetical protein
MLPSGVGGRQIDADHAVTARGAHLGRVRKAIVPVRDRDIAEAGRSEDVGNLCFQQSAGDSTGPEIDIAKCALRKHLPDDDVA